MHKFSCFIFIIILFTISSLFCSSRILLIDKNSFVRNNPDDHTILDSNINVKVLYDVEYIMIDIEADLNNDIKVGTKTDYELAQDVDYLRVQITTTPKDRFAYVFSAENGSYFSSNTT